MENSSSFLPRSFHRPHKIDGMNVLTFREEGSPYMLGKVQTSANLTQRVGSIRSIH